MVKENVVRDFVEPKVLTMNFDLAVLASKIDHDTVGIIMSQVATRLLTARRIAFGSPSWILDV